MPSSTYGKSIIFVSIIWVASSAEYRDEKSSHRSVLLENCSENCTVEISAVDKCPASYPDGETKAKCEYFRDKDLLGDNFLFIPVTSVRENIIYWNIYCALCNNKTLDIDRFDFSTLRAYHLPIDDRLEPSSGLIPIDNRASTSFISDVDLAVREKMLINTDIEDDRLFSNISGVIRKVVPLSYFPSGLKISSRRFYSSSSSENLAMINNTRFFSSALNEDIGCSGKKFCSGRKRKIPQRETCVYFDENDLQCRENAFLLENLDFIYGKSGIILKDGRTFHRNAFARTSEDEIFLCASEKVRNPIERTIDEFVKHAKYVSTFLLVVFLIMKTNRKNFSSLPKLILYSYCVAPLGIYVNHIAGHWMEKFGIIFKTYALIYLFLCHAFWVSIISYEYWYVISASLNVQKRNSELKKYSAYGFIGWILPALLLLAAYQSLSEEDKIGECPTIRGYKNINIYQSFGDFAQYFHIGLVMLSVVIFIALIPVVAAQAYFFVRLVRNSRNIADRNAQRNSNATRSISELDYLIIFTKIAYLMGIHWMIIFVNTILSIFLNSNLIYHIGPMMFACHGTFIFIAFGSKNVSAMYNKTYESFKSLSIRNSAI